MGRDIRNDETVVVHSSIALLQERFRELQRAKVMRKQKETLRRLALSTEANLPEAAMLASYLASADDHHESASLSSLSMWPTLQLQKRKRDDEEYYGSRRRRTTIINETPLLINLWPNVTADASSSSSSWECESNDVDTSLRL